MTVRGCAYGAARRHRVPATFLLPSCFCTLSRPIIVARKGCVALCTRARAVLYVIGTVNCMVSTAQLLVPVLQTILGVFQLLLDYGQFRPHQASVGLFQP